MIFAEVIGDPIAHSKSPVIYKYWLDRLGIAGDYVRTRVSSEELANFLDERRLDPDWRGCNVTIPHKQSIIPLLDRLDPGAEAIGAVNCVVPEDGGLVGYNTDVDGIAAALDSTELGARKAAIIGAGGAARAVVAYLASRGVERIALVVRTPERAGALRGLAPGITMDIVNFEGPAATFGGAAAIINASPLGMAGADPMPPSILEALRTHAAETTTVFDLVTTPAQTEFLSSGANGGGHPVDGLTMLVGQAARAFELFFGAPAPPPDEALRDLLPSVSPNSA